MEIEKSDSDLFMLAVLFLSRLISDYLSIGVPIYGTIYR